MINAVVACEKQLLFLSKNSMSLHHTLKLNNINFFSFDNNDDPAQTKRRWFFTELNENETRLIRFIVDIMNTDMNTIGIQNIPFTFDDLLNVWIDDKICGEEIRLILEFVSESWYTLFIDIVDDNEYEIILKLISGNVVIGRVIVDYSYA